MKKGKSYLQTRVYEQMGITVEQNRIEVFVKDRYDAMQKQELSIFSSDEKDNINILVYTIDRNLIYFDHPLSSPESKSIYNNREQHFCIKRLKEPKGDMKYIMPKGVGTYPFFPPSIVAKYDSSEKIKTLIITEGYFKAFKASLHNFDIVGLSSITHYADSKTKKIHLDIAKLIIKCKVENVVMLYDGDCLNISTKALQNDEDLAKRPNSFLSSMLKIRELLVDYDVRIYFSHIQSDNITNNPKGLDDLLIECAGKESEILEGLLKLGEPSVYFYKLNVSSFQKKLQGYFNLKNIEQFYGAWDHIIGEREFVYYGTKYKYDGKVLQKTVPKEAKSFMRVGDDYFEKIEVPNIISDTTEIKIYKRKKQTITDDFGKKILDSIPKYKAFINVPSHTNYQQVIHNCYNKYSPIPHEPEEGEWQMTEMFLRHIFEEHYEFGLDYLQILYQYPTQILPILCLVSNENETGKTTFIDWLKLIFCENVAKVGNAELSNEFNAFTATRLIVGVDETFVEKKSTVEKIKMLSTSNSIAMQRKGVDHEEMLHFAKYILLSNNEEKFIYANDEDVRYWVRKIKKIKNKVPAMLSILNEEIPSFLFYLNNRKISVPKTTRAWFEPKLLETDALKRLREANRPTAEKEIRKFVRDLFLDFDMEEIAMPLEYLKEMTVKNRYQDSYLDKIIKEQLKTERSKKTIRSKIPRWEADEYEDEKMKKSFISWTPCKPFLFKRNNFLTVDEIKERTELVNEQKVEALEKTLF